MFRGQGQHKDCAATRTICCVDPAAVHLGDRTADRQSQSRAGHRALRVRSKELFEHPFLDAWRNTRPFILDADDNFVAHQFAGDSNGGPLACVLGRILDQLGISPPWEAEVYEAGRGASGLHHYGGWFHFVGTIESGGDAWRLVNRGAAAFKVAEFEPLSETLAVGVHTDVALVREPFAGLPLVQLEIAAELPWVIAAEEPK